MKWVDKHVEVDPPKKPKKITGTRFAAIFNLNKWTSPFQAWCEITRTYEKPFEDTIYTVAGKVIEPKQAQYMKDSYGMFNLVTPTDIYGADPFKTTFGDFFKDIPIFGGMWDYLLMDDEDKVDTVLEMKTTKRIEDWVDDIPEYYAQQAALYAFLLGCDNVIMVCSILGDDDYNNPDAYVPSAANTITREFKVSERYPDFGERVAAGRKFWEKYVLTGISPDYDEAVDKDYLAELRKNSLNPTTDIGALVEEADRLKRKIETVEAEIKPDTDRLEEVQKMLKEYLVSQFREGDTKTEIKGAFTYTVSKSSSKTVDKDALKRDGLLNKYQVTNTTYKMTIK